jgi:2-oxoglutarate dehydrogenase E2 component (dihydrolipoamide succinyltransferase)
MRVELKVPEFGESVTEVQIARWKFAKGDQVKRDQELVELETDKATMELAAPSAGQIVEIRKSAGEIASVGEVIALIDDAITGSANDGQKNGEAAQSAQGATPALPAAAASTAATGEVAHTEIAGGAKPSNGPVHLTPSARRALQEHGLQPNQVPASEGRLRGEDVMRYVAEQQQSVAAAPAPAAPRPQTPAPQASAPKPTPAPAKAPAARDSEGDEIVPMSLIRRKIAERLVQAQKQAALLTTFNEVDMSSVMELRTRHGDKFKERYGIKLGFMSFFVRATIEALQEIRELNAEIRDQNIVYHKHSHIGIAIGSPRGLVVPILRKAETLSVAQIEQAIGDFAKRAGDGKLLPDELQGGTFTISNGGVFGSLLSTPIVNPPQSGVLGMHTIQERPIAKNGEVVIRPMMYLALTYDHRIVDGREAVTFLKRIKDSIEDPARLLLNV